MSQSLLVVTQSVIISDSRVLRELSSLEKLGRPIFLLCLDSAARENLTLKVGDVEVLQFPPPGPTRGQLAAIVIIAVGLAATAAALISFFANSAVPAVGLSGLVVGILTIVIFFSFFGFIVSRETKTAESKYFLLRDSLFGGNLLRRAILQVNPVVLHLHDLMPLGLLSKRTLAMVSNPFVVWDAHELYHQQDGPSPLRSLVKKAVVGLKIGLVNEVVTVSEGVGQQYRRDFRNFPPVTIVENGSSADPVMAKGDILQRKLGISLESEILLFQGGLLSGRGIPFLFELIVHLPASWKLVFMGSGPLESIVQESVQKNPERIFFHPAVSPNELTRYTSCATLGAIPYERVCLNHEYALPNKLWEYAVAGVPILARDLSDLSRKVLENRIGLVFSDAEGASEVAHQIREVGPAGWNAFSSSALAFATADNWRKYERNLLFMYQKLFEV